MKRLCLALVILSLFLQIDSIRVFASGFNIKSIGGVETGGSMVSKFWHTSSQPTLRGEASPGENINIVIDDKTLQIAADSAGDWVFTPVDPLTDGDHQITIQGQSSSLKFTLTTGKDNVDWSSVEKGGSETLPTAGTSWPTLSLIVLSLVSIGAGAKAFASDNKRN